MTGLFSYPKRKLRKLIKESEFEEAIALANSMEEKYQYDSDFLFIMAGMFYILEDAKKTLHYVDRLLENVYLVKDARHKGETKYEKFRAEKKRENA